MNDICKHFPRNKRYNLLGNFHFGKRPIYCYYWTRKLSVYEYSNDGWLRLIFLVSPPKWTVTRKMLRLCKDYYFICALRRHVYWKPFAERNERKQDRQEILPCFKCSKSFIEKIIIFSVNVLHKPLLFGKGNFCAQKYLPHFFKMFIVCMIFIADERPKITLFAPKYVYIFLSLLFSLLRRSLMAHAKYEHTHTLPKHDSMRRNIKPKIIQISSWFMVGKEMVML